ncbi:hypothetical protein L5515_012025 [Caenorhabditis briggsae]|uniref:F-box domain-containing protein n=1 Tax=Caenorhabditis briggsae TaxID=6238 RepID=A0AAE9EVX3_CAEBR|nr:hypothetical protein L5515_012025 [Caenorhabditis briggsae]
MPVAWSGLPSLVQEDILKEMSAESTFFLSMVSKRTVDSMSRFRNKNVSGIMMVFGKDAVGIRFETSDKNFFNCEKIAFKLDTFPRITGLYATNDNKIISEFVCESKENVVSETHNHLLDLFRKSRNLEFTVAVFDFKSYKWIPFVKRAKIMAENVGISHLEKFIDSHSDLESIHLERKFIGHISPESNLYNINHVSLNALKFPFNEFMNNFKGKSAALQCSGHLNGHVRLFIRSWLKGGYADNVKMLHVLRTGQEIFYDEMLLESFFDEVTPFEQAGVSRELPSFKEIRKQFETLPNWFQETDRDMVIERESDKKKALVKMGANDFIFLVLDDIDMVNV